MTTKNKIATIKGLIEEYDELTTEALFEDKDFIYEGCGIKN